MDNGFLAPIPEPAFRPLFSLHALESGQYLYQRRVPDGSLAQKFVTTLDVKAAFSQREEDTGWLPPGVVRSGVNANGAFYVYSAPAQKADLLLDEQQPPISVPLPRTVLVAANGQYHLFASKGARFDIQDEAFLPPFPNVHPPLGLICWGTAQPPKIDVQTARKAWEAFFGSVFSSHLAGGKSIAQPRDVREMLRSLDGKHKYPVSDLVTARSASIGNLVDHMLEGKS